MASTRPRLGVVFQPDRPIEELPDFARQAERAGFDELWVVEDCFLHGGLVAAATALAASSRLVVGVGLLPASVRNPAIVAMELATLARLHPQRLRVAFGHGVEAWMKQIGARPPDRIVALEEVVRAVRSLLAGEEVTTRGRQVRLDRVRLATPPDQAPPLLIGTTGERGIRLAGTIADGVLLPEGSGPEAVTWASRILGRRGATVVYAWLRIDEDPTRARAALRPVVRAWRDLGLYPNLMRHSGLPPDGELGPDDIDRVAIAGTPDDCAAALTSLSLAGASSVVLVPVGQDAREQLDSFAQDVMPLVLASTVVR